MNTKIAISIQPNYQDNIYYQNNPKYFNDLKNLVEQSPLGFFNKLTSTGRKREPKIFHHINI